MTRVSGALLLAGGLAGCAATAGGPRARPGEAEARVGYYADDAHLEVSSYAVRVEQPLGERASVFARGMADHVVLTPRPLHAPHASPNQPTGHRDADVVTSASSTAGEADGADEWRYDVLLGGEIGGDAGDVPVEVRAYGRVSTEPDYDSLSAVVQGTAEVAERNGVVAAFVGFGHDTITPLEVPPGQADAWPGTHDRVLLGASYTQIASPVLVLAVGGATTWQAGQLSSPYRNAVVVTTLFPEVLPDERLRLSGFASGALHVGWGTALHLRLGAYGDSWGVLAIVPEAMIAKELGPRGLLGLRYRFVDQAAASFYRATYAGIEDVMAGDARLGPLHEHAGAVSMAWSIVRERRDFGSLGIFLDQEVSTLAHEAIGHEIFAVTSTAGVEITW